MKHRGWFPPYVDSPDRHNGQRQTNGRTDEETRRPSVRLLDGV